MQNLIERALGGLKTFYQTKGLKDFMGFRHRSRNLFEILTYYPNRGEGFKVWRVDWPEHKYAIVKEVVVKNIRQGEVIALMYENNLPAGKAPVVLGDASNRGVWSHSVRPSYTRLDNGMEFDDVDFQRFKDIKFKLEKKP